MSLCINRKRKGFNSLARITNQQLNAVNTMNTNLNLSIFNFENSEVRFVDGLPIANDVAKVLGYSDYKRAVKDNVDPEYKKVVEYIDFVGRENQPLPVNSQVNVLLEPGIYQLIFGSKLPTAKKFQSWVFEEVLPQIRATGQYKPKTEEKFALPKVTDQTVKIHKEAIAQFEDSGDLQLAQLLKCRLGNLILAEQQNILKPVEVPQYEGVIDVALRLGWQVPAKYESGLGLSVKRACGHLLIGQNKRYSNSGNRQIFANMYPANNKEVESAVTEYCVKKSFYHRDIDVID